MTPTTLSIERHGSRTQVIAWIWMNRPAVHNAFDELLIEELTQAFAQLDDEASVRAIVLAGQGASFSAGADLNWMRRLGAASVEVNREDALRLAQLYRTIAHCAKPTIARVHGAAIGGGMGLAAASDICVASTQAFFAASEVRLGIIPSAIGPYVVRAIGERQACRYFQTGERIDAAKAQTLGLAHEVVEPDQLDATIARLLAALMAGGPAAQTAATQLIRAVAHRPVDDAVVVDTAQRIAAIRGTPEAQEGLGAFLAKRRPAWYLA